jgi:hypothetical protein
MNRAYRFAAGKISRSRASGYLTVTRGQIEFEWLHLMEKLRTRDPQWHARLVKVRAPQPHPLFRIVRGTVAQWEKSVAPPSKPLQRTRHKRRAAER